MHLLLFAIGILVIAVGAIMLAFSVPLVDPAGVALFTSGMTAAVGGFILIGLSAALRILGRIAERLDIQPPPVPQVVAIEHEVPPPRPSRAAPEPAVAATSVFEAPKASEASKPTDAKAKDAKLTDAPEAPEGAPAKTSLLGWFGRTKAPATPDAGVEAEVFRVRPPAVQHGAQNRDLQNRDLQNRHLDDLTVDLGALARPPEPLQAPEPAPAIPAPPAVRPQPRPAPPPAPRSGAPQNGTAATTVYRSGVIDGMAYSLFMDGSIEAELPTGKVRFGTIDELQKYLVSRR
jgi:hypothetical protein